MIFSAVTESINGFNKLQSHLMIRSAKTLGTDLTSHLKSNARGGVPDDFNFRVQIGKFIMVKGSAHVAFGAQNANGPDIEKQESLGGGSDIV